MDLALHVLAFVQTTPVGWDFQSGQLTFPVYMILPRYHYWQESYLSVVFLEYGERVDRSGAPASRRVHANVPPAAQPSRDPHVLPLPLQDP